MNYTIELQSTCILLNEQWRKELNRILEKLDLQKDDNTTLQAWHGYYLLKLKGMIMSIAVKLD